MERGRGIERHKLDSLTKEEKDQVDRELKLRYTLNTPEAQDYFEENGQYSLLSRFCYKVNNQVIKEFFSHAALAKAYDLVEPEILSLLSKKFSEPE